ncbi:unnamed protein product [Cyprideis torosa]|uniref:Uncharacterized protein n=1 Tax=Cyprideis torosa TaxID=163714 RepID=A0A7R8W8E2_9CRUS|nr:unnamed protein product [Cyprideis torosa]CAG0883129.1 unnamed protein product [Cyprideis torosa]
MIQKGVEEWLQIDLGKPHRFTGVATQGRFGNGKGQEYAESYLIQYWSDAKWIQYVNRTGSSAIGTTLDSSSGNYIHLHLQVQQIHQMH